MKKWMIVAVVHAAPVFAQNWVNVSGGSVPALAVAAGADIGGAPILYACRTTDAQGVTQVGKYSTSLGCVYYAGQAIGAATAQVLTDYSVDWSEASNGTIPSGSYNAAVSGAAVYICRASVENSRQVGQLRAGTPGCQIEFGATGGYFTTYEVLRSPWVAASNGTIPSGATQGGVDSDGLPLYICRGISLGSLTLGKIKSGFNGCKAGLSSGTVSMSSYEVLTGFSSLWQSYTGAVPSGGAWFAGSAGGQPKYVCRFTVAGTTALTPGQTGGPDSQGLCRIEYANASQSQSNFFALNAQNTFSTCTYSASPTTVNAAAGGGSATITMTSFCGWVNFPSAGWIVPDKRTGTGGSFVLTIAANASSTPRSGTVIVGGQTITINQAGACSYSLNPTSFAIGSGGATNRSVGVTAGSGCSWSANSASSWINILDPSGNGSGIFSFNVSANPNTTQRTGQILVAGQTVTVTQSGVCSYVVAPASPAPFPVSGGSIVFTPTTPTSCTLPATFPNWTTKVDGATTGSFTLSALPNVAYSGRSGTVSVGAQVIQLSQPGLPCLITRTPQTATAPPGGGTVGIDITVAHPSCTWTATTSVNYLHPSAASGQGNAHIDVAVDALAGTSARSGSVVFSSYLSSEATVISQTTAGCTYAASLPNGQPSAAGGPLDVTVTTAAGCPFSFMFAQPWILYSGSPTGPGTYTLTVLKNLGYTPRSQLVTVLGPNSAIATITVTQPGTPCVVTANPPATIPSSGGPFSFNVTVPDPGCQWTATESASWYSLSLPSGTGNGQVTGQADANPSSSARSLPVTIASYLTSTPVNISQQGTSCTYTLTPSVTNFPASGGSQTVTVTTAQQCTWNAVAANPSWITFPSAASGSGPGTFTFNVQANADAVVRNTTISAGGQTVTISQAAATCSYSLSAAGISVPANGRSDSVAVTANAGCNWTVTAPDSWVVVNSALTGTGNGAVLFNVLANPGANTRTSTLTIAGRTYVITQQGTGTGNVTSGLTFVSLRPCRILETRSDYNFEGRTGAFGPPFLNAGETRTLPMNGSSLCPIPSSAKAYVVNITLVPRGTVDFVTVSPAGEARPNVWSIRSPDGNTVANSAIVKAGVNGAINVYTSNNTDLLIDVSGYFTDNPALSNLVYYPMNPCRVIETRSDYRAAGPYGAPSMGNRETRSFRFPAYLPCAVPAGVAAYSMTITVVPQGALQFLTAWPSGTQQPNVSSINSPIGRTLANSVILPASADGSIDVHAFNSTDFLIDVNGYFAPDDGVNGQFYFPVTQCRASDSTVSGGIYNDDTTRTIDVPASAGCSGIPASARGYALNVTALPNNNPMPFLTAYPNGQGRPNASILNAFEGQIVTNSAIVPAGNLGKIDIYPYRRTNVVVEIGGYFGR